MWRNPFVNMKNENVLNKMAHSSNRDKESRGVTQEFAFV
jgi:hypothetical protein